MIKPTSVSFFKSNLKVIELNLGNLCINIGFTVPTIPETDLYNRSTELLRIHYSALVVPESISKQTGENRQAYRISRMSQEQEALRSEFCQQVFEALEGAYITGDPFFRRELAFGHSLFIWGSWFNDEKEVAEMVKDTYGISLPKRRFGVYHGVDGPFTEARYIVQEVPWKKTVGAFMVVDADEWLRHATEVGVPIEAVREQLKVQLKRQSKGEIPILNPASETVSE